MTCFQSQSNLSLSLRQANNRIELLNCTLIITVLLECILTQFDLLSKLMIHPLFYMLPLWRSEMCNYCPSKLDIIRSRKNNSWLFFDISGTRPEYHNTIYFYQALSTSPKPQQPPSAALLSVWRLKTLRCSLNECLLASSQIWKSMHKASRLQNQVRIHQLLKGPLLTRRPIFCQSRKITFGQRSWTTMQGFSSS